ncbi:MAG TPA: hypothetical protein VF897_17290 [Roseiflexaceae bacterium]
MQLFLNVLVQGWRVTLRRWRVALPLYLTGLLLGLVQTWPLLRAAGAGALSNPFLGELAGGGGDAAIDLLLGSPTAVAQTVGIWVFVALLFGLLFGLAYNFFAGGILSVYTGTRPFWAGCRRTFWAFTGLGILLLLLLLPVALAAALAGLALGPIGAAIVALILIQLVNLLGEYARAVAVVRDRRSPLALLGMAAGVVRRNLGGVLALALLGLLLHVALTLLYRVVASPIRATVVVVLWQQLVALAWLWVKLLRLAWAAGYARADGAARDVGPAGEAAAMAAV